MPFFSGRVHSIIFENAEDAYYILKMDLDPEEGAPAPEPATLMLSPMVIVRGSVQGIPINIGTWFGFEAKWTNHKKYGRQLAISRAPVLKNGWDPDTVEKILVAHDVPAMLCAQIRAHFGDDDFIKALGSAERLEDVPGIDTFAATFVAQRWESVQAHFKCLDFLSDLGLPKSKTKQIWAVFGDEAIHILSKNPWALVQVEGIKFIQADEVARKLDLDMDSPNRILGAVLYACKDMRSFGHVYMQTGTLMGAVQQLMGDVAKDRVAAALSACHQGGALVLDRETQPGLLAVYEPWMHHMEDESARLLVERAHTADIRTDPEAYLKALKSVGPQTEIAVDDGHSFEKVIATAVDEWGGVAKLTLAKDQRIGILNALSHPVSILTGLPGTGKTMSLRAAVRILQDSSIPFLLCAPTGIAAKNLAAVTGAPASTIHRAFSAKGGGDKNDRESVYAGVVGDAKGGVGDVGEGGVWGYGPERPYPADVVIIDEASMMDQHLLYRLMTCTAPHCRLVFVGDHAQLPSVGPGNVLRNLIESKCFPTVRLTEIFRQKGNNDIVLAAHAIHDGVVPQVARPSEFVLLEIHNETDVLAAVNRLAVRLYEKRDNFQVLSPRHGGTVGVTNLNARLRELLNPRVMGLREAKLGNDVIRESDRVMVVKNDYQKRVFNGDVGKIERIDVPAKEVSVLIFGSPAMTVTFTFKEMYKSLRLAYACTVHKCVHPDTLVETGQGLLPIHLVPPQGVINTPNGLKGYTHKVENPSAPAMRLTTKDGYFLEATLDHGVDVWDGGQYSRTEMRDVKEGAWVRLCTGIGVEPCVEPSLPPLPSGDVRSVSYDVPRVMTPDLAEFFGMMVADGTVYKRGFRLAKRHSDFVARFQFLCVHLFGVRVREFLIKGTEAVEVNSTLLSSWLLLLLGGMAPKKKAVPLCVLQSSSSVQRAFLRGVFADGTVCVQEGVVDHISWSTVSKGLALQVRTMLLRLGIISGTVRSQSHACETLCLYNDNVRRFSEKIGFVSKFKQDRLQFPTRPSKNASVPLSKAEASSLRKGFRDVVGVSACQNAMNRGRISRNVARNVVAAGQPHALVEVLKRRLQYHHDRVHALTPTECPTVCVEVPEGHQFFQNGFSAWNSQGLEYDVIVMPLVESFRHQLQRNLLYTAVTRAKKKVYLVGTPKALARAVSNDKEDLRDTLLTQRLVRRFSAAKE